MGKDLAKFVVCGGPTSDVEIDAYEEKSKTIKEETKPNDEIRSSKAAVC